MDDTIKPFGDNPVVDLAEYRITRGASRRSIFDRCKHKHLTFDQAVRRVVCDDCKRDLDGFDAFMSVVNGFSEMMNQVKDHQRKAQEAMSHSVISRAAKAIDKVWSGRNMAPCCPHCRAGLLPEDFANGVGAQVSRSYEMARRKADKP